MHLRSSKDTDGLNSAYLICLGLARLGRVFFWYTMSSKRDNFWYLILADIVHTILVGWFFIMYRSISKNKSKEIIGAAD